MENRLDERNTTPRLIKKGASKGTFPFYNVFLCRSLFSSFDRVWWLLPQDWDFVDLFLSLGLFSTTFSFSFPFFKSFKFFPVFHLGQQSPRPRGGEIARIYIPVFKCVNFCIAPSRPLSWSPSTVTLRCINLQCEDFSLKMCYFKLFCFLIRLF